jgi:hypothetical protein
MQYFITFVFEKGLKAVNDYLVGRTEKKCQLSSLFSTKSAVILPATQHGKMTSFFLDVIMVLLIQSLR